MLIFSDVRAKITYAGAQNVRESAIFGKMAIYTFF